MEEQHGRTRLNTRGIAIVTLKADPLIYRLTSCMKSLRPSKPATGLIDGTKVIWVEPPPRSKAATLDASDPDEKTPYRKLTVNHP